MEKNAVRGEGVKEFPQASGHLTMGNLIGAQRLEAATPQDTASTGPGSALEEFIKLVVVHVARRFVVGVLHERGFTTNTCTGPRAFCWAELVVSPGSCSKDRAVAEE